ncbi:MAG: SRPBCC family protein [Pseudonocardiaceae bacterium]
MEPSRAAVTVEASPERAFEVFTEGLGEWWPKEFSWSQDVLEEIGIEPRAGGFASERGPHGFTIHWGRVLASEPPERLVFTWQIAGDRSPQPDPGKASEVEVVFGATGDGSTSVELEHRGWERHGDGAQQYRDGFEQSGAWPYAPERFAAAASG